MYTPYLIAAIVLLLLGIVAQLILLGSWVLSLAKEKELKKARIKEEKEYQFIKGLY